MPLTKWKTLSSRYLIRDQWLTLRADRCVTANDIVLDPYYVQESPDWVQVAAVDHAGRVLITRQYRHALGQISVELPCGAVDPGEAPVAAIRRELLEETGCEVDELQALPVLSSNAARDTNRVHSRSTTALQTGFPVRRLWPAREGRGGRHWPGNVPGTGRPARTPHHCSARC